MTAMTNNPNLAYDIKPVDTKVPIDNRQGTAKITVRYALERPTVTATADVIVLGNADSGWFTIEEGASRKMESGKETTFNIRINVSPRAEEGTYSFRLRVCSEDRPMDEAAEGPEISFQVRPARLPEPDGFPWWIIAVIVGVLGLAVGGYLWRGSNGVPDVRGMTLNQAVQKLSEYDVVPNGMRLRTNLFSEDTVLAQSIVGEELGDRKLLLYIASALPKASVPDVKELTAEKAQKKLRRKSFLTQWTKQFPVSVLNTNVLTLSPGVRPTSGRASPPLAIDAAVRIPAAAKVTSSNPGKGASIPQRSIVSIRTNRAGTRPSKRPKLDSPAKDARMPDDNVELSWNNVENANHNLLLTLTDRNGKKTSGLIVLPDKQESLKLGGLSDVAEMKWSIVAYEKTTWWVLGKSATRTITFN
ncbi:MAG: hypothetical protein IH987_09130 [Planctomycetes bacterium]|nr:hypothetical protein [Planctomycetota bacterium]